MSPEPVDRPEPSTPAPVLRIDTAAMRARATDLFAGLGVRLDPGRPARGLSIADQHFVEIAKGANGEVLLGEPFMFDASDVDRFNF